MKTIDRQIENLVATFSPWWPAADTLLVRRHLRAALTEVARDQRTRCAEAINKLEQSHAVAYDEEWWVRAVEAHQAVMNAEIEREK